MYDIIWVCDRGSNLKKALEKYHVVHCIVHRLNNVLVKVFYQAETNEAKKDIAFPEHYVNLNEDEDDQVSDTDSDIAINEIFDDDDEMLIEKQARLANYSKKTSNESIVVMTLAELPSEPKRILVNIIYCKELVTYIKKVGTK